MNKKSYLLISIGMMLLCVLSARAGYQEVNSCRNLSDDNTYYLLIAGLDSKIPYTPCLSIYANNATIDCGGNVIYSSNISSSGICISSNTTESSNYTTIKNCVFNGTILTYYDIDWEEWYNYTSNYGIATYDPGVVTNREFINISNNTFMNPYIYSVWLIADMQGKLFNVSLNNNLFYHTGTSRLHTLNNSIVYNNIFDGYTAIEEDRLVQNGAQAQLSNSDMKIYNNVFKNTIVNTALVYTCSPTTYLNISGNTFYNISTGISMFTHQATGTAINNGGCALKNQRTYIDHNYINYSYRAFTSWGNNNTYISNLEALNIINTSYVLWDNSGGLYPSGHMNTTFLNVTNPNSTLINGGGNLSIYWWYEAKAQEYDGFPVENITITIYNNTNQLVYFGNTSTNGKILVALKEYSQTNTSLWRESNYTINSSCSDCTPYNYTLNLTDNTLWHTFTRPHDKPLTLTFVYKDRKFTVGPEAKIVRMTFRDNNFIVTTDKPLWYKMLVDRLRWLIP